MVMRFARYLAGRPRGRLATFVFARFIAYFITIFCAVENKLNNDSMVSGRSGGICDDKSQGGADEEAIERQVRRGRSKGPGARPPQRFMSIKDVADRLYVSTRTVCRWIHLGLVAHKIGGRVCIGENDLRAFRRGFSSLQSYFVLSSQTLMECRVATPRAVMRWR
ncbi:helix-turn-helix domain-containing protein [Bradyrhizobium sp. Ec3.3]|uniref:helix-turn-helix domain-containing protein n=1 Tax=Bradyrhizobium sp. Ec3.3 TaxID=189753 RepID=UPI003528E597